MLGGATIGFVPVILTGMVPCMSTKDVVQHYFAALAENGRWEAFLADDLRFTSFTSPVKELAGKTAYLESTKRFFSMVISVEVRDVIIEDAKACALTRYQLQAPSGPRFQSDVAELFTVKNGKIDTFAIYFDTAPFPK